MTNKAPAFQWYPKDADTDENVRMMDDAEYGFYGRCLNHSWINDGIPESFEDMSRIFSRPVEVIAERWKRVGRCFFLEDGRWRNRKQEDQRKATQEFRESRQENARARWSKQSSDARALDVQCSASASSSASATAKSKEQSQNHCSATAEREPESALVVPEKSVIAFEKSPAAVLLENQTRWFDQFWKAYWRKDGRKAAWLKFCAKVRTEAQFQRVMAAIFEQTPAMLARDVEHRPHGSTWLNQERWEDEHSPKKVGDEGQKDGANQLFQIMAENLEKRGNPF